MKHWAKWWRWLRRWPWWRRGRTSVVAVEIDEEIRSHLALRTEALVRDGWPRPEAELEAARRFGDADEAGRRLTAAAVRRRRWRVRREWVGTVIRDGAFGLRQVRRAPGMALAVICTLALGIGATAAMFSVVDAALLRPLPYPAADRLVQLWETNGNGASVSAAAYPDYLAWSQQSGVFASLEGYDPTNVIVRGDRGGSMLQGARVTTGFLTSLGAAPVLGRFFTSDDDMPGGTAVVLSHGFWEREFGGDKAVVGRSLVIDGRSYTVIGVAPAWFHYAPLGTVQLWLTLGRSEETRRDRANHWLNVLGRLRDGVTLGQADASLSAVMQRLAAVHPESNAGRGIRVVPLREEIVGRMRPVLVVLLGAVLLLLLIACANVASLVLARSMGRGREVAVRSALGAGRGRLVRQLITESLILAGLGGGLGVVVARLGVPLLLAAMPAGPLEHAPFLRGLALDGRVLMVTAAITILSGIGVGLWPALTVSRGSLTGVLRQSGRGNSLASLRLRAGLVAGQVALTATLLIAAGLLVRSLRSVLAADPGFDPTHVLTVRVALSGPRYQSELAQQLFFRRLLDEVRPLPGVQFVGAVSQLPLNGGRVSPFEVEGGSAPDSAARPSARLRGVAGDYFRALGIRIVAGRALDGRDDAGSPRAVMINESLARRLFPAGRAVGERLRFDGASDTAWTIVGVAADVKTGRLDEPAPPTIYYSHLQRAENRMSLVLRATDDPGVLADAVRARVRDLDPGAAVYSVGTMEQQVDRSPAVFARRYPLLLMAAFGLTALTLAAIGLYGTIAQTVARRTRELGIRMALGAGGGQIMRMVLAEGMRVALVGIAAGVAVAMVARHLLSALLYGISAVDPTTYIGVVVLLAAVTLMACFIPARRALRVDPLEALRAE